jgi:hypothetical protein
MTLENETYDDFIIDEWCRNVWETKKIFEFPTKTKITLKSRRPNFLDSSILSMFDDDEDGEMDSIR